MPTEIERKFLVCGDDWKMSPSTYFCQGYLNRDKHRTVRIRIAGDQGILTIKGLTTGASRPEFEYDVPLEDAQAMINLCEGSVVEKNRHIVQHAGHIWEVDQFLGDNLGLVVAEIELQSEDESFETPSWIADEVTEDRKYFNSNLSVHPYKDWGST